MLNFPKWKIFLVFAVCLIGFIIALPNFLNEKAGERLADSLNLSRINLGLDLRGGSYLLLEVDFDYYLKEQLQNLAEEAKSALRTKKIGYQNFVVKDNRVFFSLREQKDAEQVPAVIKDISRELHIEQIPGGGFSVNYSDDSIKDLKKKVVEQSLEIVRRRVDETGTKEPILQSQGDLRILLQVPGLDNPEALKNLLGKTAKLTFHMMDETNPSPGPEYIPTGDMMVLSDEEPDNKGNMRNYAIHKTPFLYGDMLINAQATISSETNSPVIDFRFNNIGAKKMADVTTENVGKFFAIILDGKVLSAPIRIKSPIPGGQGYIEGNYTMQTASDLALLLRAGALPAPIKVLEERTVGPSLGADSIAAGAKAALIGTALVSLFMILSYGLFGLFANIALIINVMLLIAALALFQATLTLPGIAGIVLTLGMAVDTNVLVFERIREEIRSGKTPIASVDHGFRHAFQTIIDTHITGLISALILYIIGTGTIKGFAVTLTIGILASLFTAIMLTRLMVVVWLKKVKPKRIPI